MKYLYALFGLVLVTSCTSLQPFEVRKEQWENKLRSWVGFTEADLIASWGIPANSYISDNSKYLQYDFSASTNITTPTPCFTQYCTPVLITNQVNSSCRVTFTVVDSKITFWRWVANPKNSCF